MQLTKTMKVAQPDDIQKLPELLLEFFRASPFQDYHFNQDKVFNTLQKMCIDRKNSIVLLSMDGDTPVGIIAGQKVLPTFADDEVALELAWYLKPEYRKSRRGLELLDGFEEWAKLVGCKFVQYSILKTGEDDNAVEKIYKHRGFHQTEAGFQKRL